MAKTTKTQVRPLIAEWDDVADYLTVQDPYIDLPNGALAVYFRKTSHFRFAAVTNTLEVQILASIDGGTTYPIVEVSTFDVTVATPVLKVVTIFYTHMKIQVRPKVSATHGTLQTTQAGASF